MVRQASNWEGNILGTYRESRSATTQEVNRINFLELQRMIEGESVIMFNGRVIRAKMFHVETNLNGPIRRAQPIPLPSLSDLDNLESQEDNILDSYFSISEHQTLLERQIYPVWSADHTVISRDYLDGEEETFLNLVNLEISFGQSEDKSQQTASTLLRLKKDHKDHLEKLKEPEVQASDDIIINEIRALTQMLHNQSPDVQEVNDENK